jgi:hypothetical protein
MRSENEVWVEDEDAPNCFVCNAEFSMFLRRHHCRRCGNVVCYEHSEHQVVIPRLDPTALQRVCDKCYALKPSMKTPAKVKPTGGDSGNASSSSSSSGETESNVKSPDEPASDNSSKNDEKETIKKSASAPKGKKIPAAPTVDKPNLLGALLSLVLSLPMLGLTVYCMAKIMEVDLSKPPFSQIANIMTEVKHHAVYKTVVTSRLWEAGMLHVKSILLVVQSSAFYQGAVWSISEMGERLDVLADEQVSGKLPWVSGFIVSFLSLRFLVGDSRPPARLHSNRR